MNVHLRDEPAPALPARGAPARRGGPTPSAAVAIHLQRAAGNAAVSGLLRAARPGDRLLAVQRCGPTPCDCSPEERAEAAVGGPEHMAEEAPAPVA